MKVGTVWKMRFRKREVEEEGSSQRVGKEGTFESVAQIYIFLNGKPETLNSFALNC